jgi:hypothetical protein
METKNNVTKIKCSSKCWDCTLKGTEGCPKNRIELKPLRNPLRTYRTRWHRRMENELSRKFVFSFNQRICR